MKGNVVIKGGKPQMDSNGDMYTPIKGEIYFPKGTKMQDVAHLHGIEAELSENIEVGGLKDLFQRVDNATALLLEIAKIVKEMADEPAKSTGHDLTNLSDFK